MGLYLNLPRTSSLSSQHTPETGDLPGGRRGTGRWVRGGQGIEKQEEVAGRGGGWHGYRRVQDRRGAKP